MLLQVVFIPMKNNKMKYENGQIINKQRRTVNGRVD